jgi:hypothetical protein
MGQSEDVSLSKFEQTCQTEKNINVNQTNKAQETTDDENTPLFLRHLKRANDVNLCHDSADIKTCTSARVTGKRQNQPNLQAANSGRRPTRASTARGKKLVQQQTVVISSSEGHVSEEEDSSPSSEWNGSDGGKPARRSRPSERRRRTSDNEDEESEEEDGSSGMSSASLGDGNHKHEQKNFKNNAQCTLKRPGRGNKGSQSTARRFELHPLWSQSV